MEPIPLQPLLNIFRVKNTVPDRYKGCLAPFLRLRYSPYRIVFWPERRIFGRNPAI
jgi:hypothetical protein